MKCFLLSLVLLCGCGGTVSVYDQNGMKHDLVKDKIVSTSHYDPPDGSGGFTMYITTMGEYVSRDDGQNPFKVREKMEIKKECDRVNKLTAGEKAKYIEFNRKNMIKIILDDNGNMTGITQH